MINEGMGMPSLRKRKPQAPVDWGAVHQVQGMPGGGKSFSGSAPSFQGVMDQASQLGAVPGGMSLHTAPGLQGVMNQASRLGAVAGGISPHTGPGLQFTMPQGPVDMSTLQALMGAGMRFGQNAKMRGQAQAGRRPRAAMGIKRGY